MDYLRIWQEIDTKDIENHIILVDDQIGYCPSCKEINIKLVNLENCPGCNREFKYISSAESRNGKSAIVKRIKSKLPNLIFVDYDDYEVNLSKKKANDLFSI